MTREREKGTIRRGDGRRYDAIRDPGTGRVWATRGFGEEESYFGTTARLAATFEPERLTLSGCVAWSTCGTHE